MNKKSHQQTADGAILNIVILFFIVLLDKHNL